MFSIKVSPSGVKLSQTVTVSVRSISA